MTYVSSYNPTARVPKVGSRWVWEIDKPHARELIEIADVLWNGEEWWVRTRSLPGPCPPSLNDLPHREHLNDLSRFWEAVTPVGTTAIRLSQPGDVTTASGVS